MLALENK